MVDMLSRPPDHNFEAYIAHAEQYCLDIVMNVRRDPETGSLLLFAQTIFEPGVEWLVTGAIVAPSKPRKKGR